MYCIIMSKLINLPPSLCWTNDSGYCFYVIYKKKEVFLHQISRAKSRLGQFKVLVQN